ncbi:hypothetical protein EJB05_13964, partial [Eragrostis curvula]
MMNQERLRKVTGSNARGATRCPVSTLVIAFGWGRSALVGNALYMLFQKKKILKYDLSTGQVSVMKVPPVRTTKVSKPYVPIELMTMEDGHLEFARVVRSRLFLWSRDAEDVGWELREVIELKDLLPLVDPLAAATPDLVCFAEGVGVIFLTVGFGTFALDVKSNWVAKVYEGSGVKCLVPYINFCTPGTNLRHPHHHLFPNTASLTFVS